MLQYQMCNDCFKYSKNKVNSNITEYFIPIAKQNNIYSNNGEVTE